MCDREEGIRTVNAQQAFVWLSQLESRRALKSYCGLWLASSYAACTCLWPLALALLIENKS